MKKELMIVVGIQSNYRTLLKQAIGVGENYNFATRILDLNALVEGWKPYPNDWAALGLESHVTKIGSIQELRRFAQERTHDPSSIVLFLYPPTGSFRTAWKVLQAKFPETGLITISPVPNMHRQSDNPRLKNPLHKLRTILRRVKSYIKPNPSFWIISGSECIPIFTSYFRSIRKTRLIYTHSLEYELFHYSASAPNDYVQRKNNYILMLDQGWYSKPKPDFLSDDQYPPAPREKFGSEIRSFLHRLSVSTGLDVIVSCHPKANIDDTKALYAGFEVVDEPSSELIRNCEIAIANSSTSIGYAILANKPLVLFTSDELSRSIVHESEVAISRELGVGLFNISKESIVDIDELKNPMRKSRYSDYIHRYICQESAPKLPLWDSVFSSLSQIS